MRIYEHHFFWHRLFHSVLCVSSMVCVSFAIAVSGFAIVGGVDDQSVGGNVIPVVIFHGILPSVCTKMHSKSDWTQSRCPINCQEIQCSLVSHQNPLQSN
eukprot:304286_1